eukprot:13749.XXX_1168132_1168239_1 [CDS] Oithona nana genome sequencing.
MSPQVLSRSFSSCVAQALFLALTAQVIKTWFKMSN